MVAGQERVRGGGLTDHVFMNRSQHAKTWSQAWWPPSIWCEGVKRGGVESSRSESGRVDMVVVETCSFFISVDDSMLGTEKWIKFQSVVKVRLYKIIDRASNILSWPH